MVNDPIKLALRPVEVAAALGISRAKTYELLAAGILPSVRLGTNTIRVPVDALRAWMNEHIASQAASR